MKLILLLLVSLTIAVQAMFNNKGSRGTNTRYLKTHSIGIPYIDDVLQSRWFDFGGHTFINTNKYIRLTSTKSSQQGYLWSRSPLTDANFQIEFEFKVGGSSSDTLYGDGFAMWLTTQRNSIGTVFGSVNPFKGLGIFFDTYKNEVDSPHDFPYITSMLGDGIIPYDNGVDGRTTELAGCQANFRNRDTSTLGRLTYYKKEYLLFEVQWKEEGLWTECFRASRVVLPDNIYLGFTAHTGELSDNHDIISVVTRTLMPIVKEETAMTKPAKLKQNGNGFFLVKMMVVGGLLCALYMGYKMYEAKYQKQF